ncbi:uncharacterized protein TERG_12039 [Trichophyton rubrum CBS 118892]|uniref:Uncharacterized protein n=1 Tax=Trichophyton rubrum (strain ATCC MYA-4607 / CBS 118892) TaxID=559305 RepID=A0A080WIS7_TRIRC|nr:uncharacterized protein TERG_12039 [Trichophyton rubrum CBS 118892]KFL61299.1 hypothetical protein TERG_12039 [Trichophyton rubrum CBS 118892]
MLCCSQRAPLLGPTNQRNPKRRCSGFVRPVLHGEAMMSFGGRTKSMHGTSQRTRGDEMLAGMVLQYLPLPPGYDMTCRRVKPQAHVYIFPRRVWSLFPSSHLAALCLLIYRLSSVLPTNLDA